MKSLLFVAASVLALAAGGCTAARSPAARAALDCPAVEGDLTRTTVAPDGRTCTYRSRDGGEISLQLVNTGGDPSGALKAIEASLVGPAAPAAVPASAAETGTAEEAARVAEQARQDAGGAAGADVAVDIDVHGRKIVSSRSDDGGETTRVDLPGIHIVAGENDANVRVGGITINANDDKATVRVVSDQRLKGEAFSREKRGLRATFIYTGKDLPNGYHVVGYEAAGPKAGPLTVAVVRSKSSGDSDHHDLYPDVKRLVRRNAGV